MKKKSLLLAIAAMSMAAVGVGTVGTFAWYSTTAAATVANNSASTAPVTVTTDVPQDLAQQFKLDVTIARVRSLGGGEDGTAMQLTTYNANPSFAIDDTQASEDHFYFGYFVNGTLHYRSNQLAAAKDFWRLYSVTVKLAVNDSGKVLLSNDTASPYTETEALQMLAGESTGNNGYTLALARKSGETNNRAVFKVENSSATTASSAYTDVALNLAASATKLVSGGATYHFGMYIEGSHVVSSAEASDDVAVTGGFTITATAAHVSYN